MNINKMIRRIKREIGIYGIALPIENLDELILEILEDTTLPVFSLYCPHQEKIPIDTSQLKRSTEVYDDCDLYIIPENVFSGRKLLYVKRIEYNESYLRSAYYPRTMTFNGLDDLSNLLCANVAKNVGDMITNSVTFHYEHPRKLYIYDTLISTSLVMTVCFEHDNSFASITPTSEESFLKLAKLDVKSGLYHTIKHYEGIETPLGRIELKIDDWQSADADRKELISEWEENYLLDAVDFDFN